MHRFPLVVALLAPCACANAHPTEPSDVDLSTVRAGFHCDTPRAEAEPCRILDAFAAAGPVTAWPSGSEVQIWLGVDHCVKPTATTAYDVYQQVYLKAGGGSPLPTSLAVARTVPYAAMFGSNQLQPAAMPNEAAALRALAAGKPVDPTRPPESPMFPDGAGAYRSLAHTLSGRSIGDGPADTGTWFLRSDGTHLLLVGPKIQGGCTSELYRVPR